MNICLLSLGYSSDSEILNTAGLNIMRLSEIKPGMKGYGLSVFQGTKPETFGIEVISILKKAQPDRDLILVKCSGKDLEISRIVAGMSGSPVYIDDKLIGALAYAWRNSIEPIAGITPIESILRDYNTPLKENDITTAFDIFNKKSNTKKFENQQITTIQTPIMLSGFSNKIFNEYSDFFDYYNMLPFEMSGAGLWDEKAKYEPGAAIAIPLITGDWSASGIGTITAITNDGKILAFGHPMYNLGNVEFPAATAGVHTVMKNNQISWKMGSPIEMNGALVQDRFATIIIDPLKKSNMIPFSISLDYPKSNIKKNINLQVVNNKNLTPMLLLISAVNSIYSTANVGNAQITIYQNLKLKFNDTYTLEYNFLDYSNYSGAYSLNIFQPLFMLFENPFKKIELQNIEYKTKIINDELVYKISDVIPSKITAVAGETITLKILLTHNNKPDTFVNLKLYIPEECEELRNLQIFVTAGNRAPLIKSDPQNFDEFCEYIKQIYSNNDIVVFFRLPNDKILVKNRLFESSTFSVNSKLLDAPDRFRRIPNYSFTNIPQDFIVYGSANTRITLEKKLQ
ncbi:MAG TPA: SpoIVB peptidase S55 domain-containing protein [bacterium]|nr:SpoIVB peptidase S55 domain-containing protein [bacterium]